MNRSMLAAAAAVALMPLAAHAQGQSTSTQNAPSQKVPTLRSWLESQFLLIGRSCLGSYKAKPGKSVIPNDITTGWGALLNQLDREATVYPTYSVNRIFTTVWRRNAGGDFTRVGDPFATTWSTDIPPLLYKQESNAHREHNCTTMLAATAASSLNITFIDISAALNANTTNQESLTAFLYAGKMFSPVTSALGLYTPAAYSNPAIAEFPIIMTLWNWYRNNPGQISATDLVVMNDVDGVAFYRVKGITQKALLSGDGGFRFAIPFLSASASAEASTSVNSTSHIDDFSLVTWGVNPRAFPTPDFLAGKAAKRAQFASVDGNPTTTNGSPFYYSLDLINTPNLYCDMWGLKAPAAAAATQGGTRAVNAATSGTRATVSNLSVSEVTGDPNRCRFTFLVTPPASVPGGQLDIPLTLTTSITPSQGTPVDMVIATPLQRFTVNDTRSEFTLFPPEIVRVVLPATPAGATQRVVIPYRVTERTAKIQNVLNSIVPVQFACGETAQVANGQLSFSRDGSDAKVQMQLDVPLGWFGDIRSNQAAVRCSVAASIGLSTTTGIVLNEVALPSFSVDVTREAPPATTTDGAAPRVVTPTPTPTTPPATPR